jgi:hypothetical protein
MQTKAADFLSAAFFARMYWKKAKGSTAQFPPYGLSTASAAAARHLRCQNAR